MNPFDFLTDDQFEKIKPFLNEKKVRNQEIRRKYAEYRKAKISQPEALEKLRVEYPYLQWETVRKLVYQQ